MLRKIGKLDFHSVLTAFFLAGIAGYFVYHIVIGARGIVSWAVLSRKVVKLENRLAEIKKENKFLENKVHGMRSESLDLDLLEEQAEKILCFSYPQDTIVLLPNE